MAKSLPWCVALQQDWGVFPDSTSANAYRDRQLARINRVDGKQHGIKNPSASDFQTSRSTNA